MRKFRVRHAALVASLVVIGGVAIAPAPAQAQVATRVLVQDPEVRPASPADCDANGVVGRFRRVGSGASFDFRGRVVELQNESAIDRYSRGEIKSGRQAGDAVWVDRSYRKFSSHGIVSDADAKRDGWKLCGRFGTRTQSVYNDDYAARVCVEVQNPTAYRCGAWYVD